MENYTSEEQFGCPPKFKNVEAFLDDNVPAMTDLTKIFIDLSKLSEEEQKHIISLLPKPENRIQYEIVWKFTHLNFVSDLNKWIVQYDVEGKTELTYPEFIKLFEGGEDNNGWIKIESKSQYDLLENGEYHWYNINTGRYDKGDLWEFGTFTHYQPIQKPLPPKF